MESALYQTFLSYNLSAYESRRYVQLLLFLRRLTPHLREVLRI